MKTEVISNITKDMEDSLTDYQLNKLKESFKLPHFKLFFK